MHPLIEPLESRIAPATLSISDIGLQEGDNGFGGAVFTVTLANVTDPTTPLSFNFATEDGSASAGSDYVARSGTETFTAAEIAAGVRTKTITVTTNGDTLPEPEERFRVRLSGESGATLERGVGEGILFYDAKLRIEDLVQAEGNSGNSQANVQVTLIEGFGDNSIPFATANGTAVAGSDYVANRGMLLFTAAELMAPRVTKTIPVQFIGDLNDEASEGFSVTLTAPERVTLLEASATVTIANDDALLRVNDVTVAEGDSGTSAALFTVTLSSATVLPVSVSFRTAEGSGNPGDDPRQSALSGGELPDFTALTDQMLTFAPGETSKTIAVLVNGDLSREATENRFRVLLSGEQNARLVDGSGLGTIVDAGDPLPTVSVNSFALPEGDGGTRNASFQLTLSSPSDFPITVRAETQDGTATSAPGGDFQAVQLQVAIPERTRTVTVAVPVFGDTIAEEDETFQLTLLGAGTDGALVPGNLVRGTATIQNDETSFTIDDPVAGEGNTGVQDLVFTVTRSGDLSREARLDFATADGAAVAGRDYTATSGLLTFLPGIATLPIPVQVLNERTIDSALNEGFFVNLSNPRNAVLNDVQAVGTIIDNDQSLVQTLSIADVAVNEDSQTTAVFPVTLSEASDTPVTVRYSTANGTAVAPGDFTALTNQELVFAPGETTGSISVLLAADAVEEPAETFSVVLSQASGGVTIVRDTGTATIAESDLPTISIVNPTPLAEGAAGTTTPLNFTVSLSKASTRTITVNAATMNGTATGGEDFTAKTELLTFLPNETSKTVTVTILGDNATEPTENFLLQLSGAVNATVANSSATGTILSDETRFTISNAVVSEGETAIFTITREGDLSRGQSLSARTSSGTATSGTDFQSVATTVVFAPGDTTQPVEVKTFRDGLSELAEDYFLTLTGTDVLVGEPGRGVINATPVVTILDTTGPEGSGAGVRTFTINLSTTSNLPISVTYRTADDTAIAGQDYTAVGPTTVTFALSESRKEISIPILGDLVDEPNERFQVLLSNPVNVTLNDTFAFGNLTNDDNPVLGINNVSVVEGDRGTGTAIFTATLSGVSAEPVTVRYSTLAGTAQSTGAAADFVEQSGTLTFAPGELSRSIAIVVNGDTAREADETFNVRLEGATNATILPGAVSGLGTIVNGGDTLVALAINDAARVEGQTGSGALVFQVELSQALTSDVTFTPALRNGTAVLAEDFTGITFPDRPGQPGVRATQFTIAAGTTTVNVPVTVLGERVFEPTESFFVTLGNVSANAAVGDGEARGTIYNDDLNTARLNARSLQWIDVDGDLVTLTLTRGSLGVFQANNFNNDNFRLADVPQNPFGGKQLQLLDLATFGSLFAGTDIRITADRQPGFPGEGDGRVDVGFINAANFIFGDFEVQGVDLGVVQVEGDLAKLTAGDEFANSALRQLDVISLGARGRTTGAVDVQSNVIGPVRSVLVRGDLAGQLRITGAEFGDLGSLVIQGALRGGDAADSGQVSVTGTLGRATIGEILGGEGDRSGLIFGSATSSASVGTVKVLGEIRGGEGNNSGGINSPRIGNVTAEGLLGGAGLNSGALVSGSTLGNVTISGDIAGGTGAVSGALNTQGRLGAVRIAGDLIGGDGRESGTIGAGGAAASITLTGALRGGAGEFSGRLAAGGVFGPVTLGTNVDGDSLVGGAGKDSGTIFGRASLTSVIAAGDLRAGSGLGAGTVRADTINALTVRGSVLGTETNSVYITATGLSSDTAIRNISIQGSVAFAEILAGYDSVTERREGGAVLFSDPRGQAQNADAKIGLVTIGGSVRALNIVAGAIPGTDGRFGDDTDDVIGSALRDDPRVFSGIASVIIRGAVLQNTDSFGIVAQQITSVKTGARGVSLVLERGAGNNLAPGVEVAADTNFRAVELPVTT